MNGGARREGELLSCQTDYLILTQGVFSCELSSPRYCLAMLSFFVHLISTDIRTNGFPFFFFFLHKDVVNFGLFLLTPQMLHQIYTDFLELISSLVVLDNKQKKHHS